MSDTTTKTADAATDVWDDAKWHRYGYLAGVLFVVLQVVSFAVSGSPPDRDASAAEIGAYFVDNADGIKLGAILFGVAFIPAIWFIASLWRTIARLEPSGPRLAVIALIGFVMSGAISAGAQALFVAPALRPDTLVGSSEFVWVVGFAAFGFSSAATAAHMMALGALVLWKRFLPAWMGYLAFASAALSALGIVAAGTEVAVFGLLVLLGFLTWMAWVLIASILLYRSTAP
ncbi:MAG: hypothetical protein HKN44_08845 [Ilumatobacter sp.]|nr:hypothetical protein [Ilumatobacter sp.]